MLRAKLTTVSVLYPSAGKGSVFRPRSVFRCCVCCVSRCSFLPVCVSHCPSTCVCVFRVVRCDLRAISLYVRTYFCKENYNEEAYGKKEEFLEVPRCRDPLTCTLCFVVVLGPSERGLKKEKEENRKEEML